MICVIFILFYIIFIYSIHVRLTQGHSTHRDRDGDRYFVAIAQLSLWCHHTIHGCKGNDEMVTSILVK